MMVQQVLSGSFGANAASRLQSAFPNRRQSFHTVDEYRDALESLTREEAAKENINGVTDVEIYSGQGLQIDDHQEEKQQSDDEPLSQELGDQGKKCEQKPLASNGHSLVDEYFEFVAASGRTHLSWEVVRVPFLWKLQNSINEIMMREADKLEDDLLKMALIENEQIRQTRDFVMEKARGFTGVPFTIQRLCELIVLPTLHYRKTDVFLRALQRTINVSTTVNEEGERVTGAEGLFSFEDNDVGETIPVERNFIVSVDELDDPLPQPPPAKKAAFDCEDKRSCVPDKDAEKSHVDIDECFFPPVLNYDSSSHLPPVNHHGSAGVEKSPHQDIDDDRSVPHLAEVKMESAGGEESASKPRNADEERDDELCGLEGDQQMEE